MIDNIDKLKELSFTKQLAFGYLTCVRLYPNYVYFSNNFNFGSQQVLRKAIDFLYLNIFEKNPDRNKIDLLIKNIDKNIPEPADYDTILASSALDACTVIIETLNFLADKKTSRLHDISTMATDTADMYIQDIDALDYNTDKDFQEKIDNHPLMKKEVATQKGVISFLYNSKDIDFEDIQTLLHLQENNQKGSLGL
jgi:uncharacterized protein YjaG (DUF416 family)